jgi:hypothetical protein
LWERFLKCGKGFATEKKWESFQNSRKGFRMTIWKLERGGKERERKAFSPSRRQSEEFHSLVFDLAIHPNSSS